MKYSLLYFKAFFKFFILTLPFFISNSAQSQLIAQYDFSGNANDASGNGYHGVVNGATLTADRFGKENSAYLFSTNSYIDLEHTETLNMSQFTLSAWAKFVSGDLPSIGSLVSKHLNGYPNGFKMAVYGDSFYGSVQVSNYEAISTNTVGDDLWHHYSMVFDGSEIKIYLDGSLVKTGLAGAYSSNDMKIRIGKDSDLSQFFGAIDDIKFFDFAIDQSKVNELFNEGGWPLIAQYDFSGDAIDATGNGYNGVVNGATLTTDRFGNANSAYLFNGSSTIDVANIPISEITATTSLWVKYEGNGGGLFQASNGGAQDRDIYVSSGVVNARLYQEQTISFITDPSINDGKWHHIVHTFGSDIGGQMLYMDGILLASGSKSNSDFTWQTDINIGFATAGGYFTGSIDDVRIFNSTLTQEEIREIYNEDGWPLTAKYDFSGDANDALGNGINGVVSGADLASDRFDNAQSAYYLDATDVISFGNNFQGYSQATYSIWYKPVGLENTTTLFSKYNSSDLDPTGFYAYLNPSGEVAFGVADAADNRLYANTLNNEALVTDQWYHIVFQFDGTQSLVTDRIKIFLNGELKELDFLYQTSYTSLPTNSDDFYLGRSVDSQGNLPYLNGVFDDFSVHNSILSESQVLSIYQKDGWDATEIKAFSFAEQTGVASIDVVNSTISIEVARGSDASSLIPTFSLSAGASISGVTSGGTTLDFSIAKTLTVTSQDGLYQEDWIVTVTVDDGILAQYDFTGDATDSSGNGLDGTSNSSFLTTDRFDNANSAYSFSGFSYLSIPTDPLIEFGSDRDIAISGWFKTTASSGVLFDKSDGFTGFIAYFPDDFSNQITFFMVQNGVGSASLLSTAGYNDGFWHHFVFKADRDAGMEIYIDGVLDASNTTLTNSININTSEDFLIGVAGEAGNTNLNTYFNGKLDDFKIYNYLPTSEEIVAEYEAVNPVVETANLVARYDFNGDILDGSGNAYDGSVNGGATPSLDRFSNSASAYSFDGTGFISSDYGNTSLHPKPKSVSLWFKSSSFGGNLISYGIHDPYGFSMGYDVSVSGTAITFRYANGTDPNNAPFTSSVSATVNVSIDEWHHFAYSIKDGSMISFYLDNTQVHTATLNNPNWWTETNKYLRIGEGFVGEIDDVNIYDGPIDVNQVSELFNEVNPNSINFSPSESSLVIPFGGTYNFTTTINNTTGSDIDLDFHVFTGDTISFEKLNFADWSLTENQDLITNSVAFTRQNSQGLYNPLIESSYSSVSPTGTLWSSSPSSKTDTYINTWVISTGNNPPGMVGNVFSFVTDDSPIRQFDILFSSWAESASGGGFAYKRTEVPTYAKLVTSSILVGSSATVELNIDTKDLAIGSYSFDLVATDGIDNRVVKSISFEVSGAPIVQYNFSGDATDVSGNGYNGTVTGPSLSVDRFDNLDAAYSFNGVDNSISVENVPIYNTLTVSTWFKTSHDFSSQSANIMDMAGSFGMAIGQGNNLTGVIQLGPGNWVLVNSGLSVNDGNWHHAAMTFDGSVFNLYLDGFLVDTYSDYTGPITYQSNPATFTVGYAPGISNSYFTGEIDDIKYYSAPLSGADVQALYSENGWTSAITAKVGYYLDGPSGFSSEMVMDGYPNRWGGLVNIPEGAGNLYFYFNDDLSNLRGDDDSNGIVEPSSSGIPVSAGLHYVTINSFSNEYRINPITRLGLLGSARTGSDATGWNDPDTEMVADSQLGVYSLSSVPLFTGQIKFRANNDWSQGNWGDNEPDGILNLTGNNIYVSAGVYDISVDLLNSTYSLINSSTERQIDSLNLVSLYNSTNGAQWTNNANWLTGSMNTWYGVGIINNRVDSVNLIGNNLEGVIPTSIGSLSAIRALYLNSNKLSGGIPFEIGNLTDLTQLGLSNNKLSGEIPTELGNLTNLTFLTLRTNRLTGTVPNSLLNLVNLRNLYLFTNQLTSIPDISTLPNLVDVNISGNRFGFENLSALGGLASLGNAYVFSPQIVDDSVSIAPIDGEFISLTTSEVTSGTNYQWKLNGADISGQNSPYYEFNFTAADEGVYTVSMTNDLTPGLIINRSPYLISDGVNQTPTPPTLYLFEPGDGYPIFITEGLPANTFIARLHTEDDAVDTHTYSLIEGIGSTNNDLVTISGNILRTTSILEYDVTSSIEILVQVTDNSGASSTQSFVIDVLPVAECMNDVFTSTSGTFTDGSGTFNYANNYNCSWLIDLPQGYTIEFGFTEFDIEQDFDFVYVYDGYDSNAPLIGQFSGSSIPAQLTSTSNQLYVQFVTDGLVNGAGWSAYYNSFREIEIGLVGYYPFVGGSANDESGNGFNGTASSGAQFTKDRFGYSASSFEPQNNGQYIEINHGGSWDLNGVFAFSAWVRTNAAEDVNNYNEILSVDGFGSFYVQGNELVYANSLYYITTVGNPFLHKQWNLVTLTIDADNIARIYLNGIEKEIFYSLDGTTGFGKQVTRPSSSSQFFYIGNPYGQTERFFDGSIDDVRVYSGSTLTSEQVLELYQSERPDDLRVHFPFTLGELTSSNGYGFAGEALTSTGTPTTLETTADRLGNASGALLFQNTGNQVYVIHERSLNLRNRVTLNMWVRPTALPPTSSFGDVLFNDGAGGRLIIYPNGGLTYHYPADNGTTYPTINTPSGLMMPNTWKMVTMTISEDNILKLYVNGQLQSLTENNVSDNGDISNYTNYGSPDRFYLAQADEADSDRRFFDGALDDVKVYQTVLSDSEIADLYNQEEGSLIAHYTFDGDAEDETGYNRDGTVDGAILATDRFGNPNRSFSFDGVNDNITSNFTLGGTTELSFASWINFKATDTSGFHTILEFGDDAPSFSINDGKLALYPSLLDDSQVPRNKWVHVAATMAGDGTTTLFIDGQPVETGAATTVSVSGLGLGIGYGVGDQYFNGGIDEVRIYRRALSNAEVLAIYESESNSMAPPLAPTNLVGKITSPTSVQLTWTDNSVDENNFTVKIFGGGNDGTPLEFAKNTTQALIEGLTANTTYTLEVVAFNDYGNSLTSVEVTPIELSTPIVSVSPSIFTLDEEITITYYSDRSYPVNELVGESPIYMHSGLILPGNEGSGAWTNTVGNWGQDDGVGLMSANGDGSWSITLVPQTYFNVSSDFIASQVGLVFRNADGTKVGKDADLRDIYIDVYDSSSISNKSPNSFDFDGNSWLVAYSSDLGNSNAWSSVTNFTIEEWVNIEEMPSLGFSSVLFSRDFDYSLGVAQAYVLALSNPDDQSGPEVVLQIFDGNTTVDYVSFKIDDTYLGTWHHWAGTYDGSNLSIFLDGILVVSSQVGPLNLPTSEGPDESIYVGYSFIGGIDEVRLWNYARSSSEIRGTIESELTTLPAGLSGYWKLNELITSGSDLITLDATSNMNDLYVIGDVDVEALPDIGLSFVTVPAQMQVGNDATVEILLSNSGTEDAVASIINKIFLSQTTTLDGGSVAVYTSPLTDINVVSGGSQLLSITFTVPSLEARDYFIIVEFDASNGLEELTENDNVLVSTNSVSLLDLPPLDAPTNLQASNVTTSSFRISWSTVALATGYSYQVAQDVNFTNIISSASGSNTSVDLSGLAPSTTYHYRVLAFNDLQQSEYSTNSITTLDILSAPASISATSVTEVGFNLGWSSVSGANQYFYEVATDNAFTAVISTNTTTATSAAIGQLSMNTTYHFRVKAIDTSTSRESTFTTGSATTLSDTAIPTVTISTPTNKTIPTSVTITINTTDNVGVSVVEFYKRGALDAEGTETRVTLTSSDIQSNQEFQTTVSAADFDERGVSFYAIAFDAAGNESEPTAIKTITRDIPPTEEQTIQNIMVGATEIDYQILAFPYQSANVASVIGLPVDDEVWRISNWTGGSYNYTISNFSPGFGYWLIINDPASTSLNFNNVSPVPVDEFFTISLRNGWTQIGNPYLQEIDWQAVRQYNITKGNITSSELNSLFIYSGGYITSNFLNPFQGAFVESNRAISLQIPLSAISGNRVNWALGQPRDQIVNNGGWELVFDIRANDGLRYGVSGIGQYAESQDREDAFDLKTPILFDRYIRTEFIDQSLNGARVARSIHGLNGNDTWLMQVETSYPEGTPMTIAFNGKVDLASDESLVILNIEDGSTIEWSEGLNWTFAYKSGTMLKMIKGNDAFINAELLMSRFVVADVFPNPTEGSFRLPIYLPDLGQGQEIVETEFSDLSGRSILKSNHTLSVGLTELNFNLVDANLTTGLYLIQVTYQGRKITQKVYLKRNY